VVDERWTGVLQKILGDGYEIIEEGLCGRTTNLDDANREGRNGAVYLKPCLESHSTLDLVIIFLGTNDLKQRYNRGPSQVADGIEELVKIVQDPEYNYGKIPQIIVLSPPVVVDTFGEAKEKYAGGGEKSRQVSEFIKQVADRYDSWFIDLAEIVESSQIDGFHLEKEAHRKIAEEVVRKVRSLAAK